MIDLLDLLRSFSVAFLLKLTFSVVGRGFLKSRMSVVVSCESPAGFSLSSPRPFPKVLTPAASRKASSYPLAPPLISPNFSSSEAPEALAPATEGDSAPDATPDVHLATECCKRKGLHDKQRSTSETNPQTLGGPGILIDSPELSSEKAAPSVDPRTNHSKLRKRPARLVLPDNYLDQELRAERCMKRESEEFEVEGRDYCLASKRGRRDIMEDRYEAVIDIAGDPKQAFFTVIDGHGGTAAAEYVAEHLGKNIIREVESLGDQSGSLEEAIRGGYLVTDRQFLSQGVASGACAASVLLKDGYLHIANAGDCRVVLSRSGVADRLTVDQRVSREEERLRIENSGGFVHCRNGVWRVHGSLAVSRAIGDLHLKDWIISEPEIKKVEITLDCDFLIMASDGLWDKVNDQEAVDLVGAERNLQRSCKKLVEFSSSRGNMDDITVILIDLRSFVVNPPLHLNRSQSSTVQTGGC